jgi:hypothetical protein
MNHYKIIQNGSARDEMKSHIGGPIILTKYVPKTTGDDKNKPDGLVKLQEKAYSQLLAYMYLDNADKAKYGSLLTGLHTQTSVNDQYPKSITEANNVLSNHHFDNAGKHQNNKPNNNNDKGANNNNNKEETPEMSFVMVEGKCYCCGKAGHKSLSCCLKDKAIKRNGLSTKPKQLNNLI